MIVWLGVIVWLSVIMCLGVKASLNATMSPFMTLSHQVTESQKVILACAVYNDADIYLLDDPLSAVDSHAGKNIFRDVFSSDGLLRLN